MKVLFVPKIQEYLYELENKKIIFLVCYIGNNHTEAHHL